MKKLAFALVFTAGAAYAGLPVIDDTSITARQDGGKTVVIGYTMYPATEGDAEPAIVTVDVQTNCIENAETKWVSIGGGHLTTLSGDVNRIVQHTADHKHRILWNPTAEGLPNLKIAADSVRVAVTAWATNTRPHTGSLTSRSRKAAWPTATIRTPGRSRSASRMSSTRPVALYSAASLRKV